MKPLKILLGNNTFAMLAGSETWMRTLALELKKQGHSVEGFSPELGIISQELQKNGVPCYNDISTSGIKPFSFILEESRNYDYDVIIASHWHIVKYLREQFPKTPIISVIHGVIHKTRDDAGREIDAPEHPALDAQVNQFVAVSEEVREMLLKEYRIDAMLVRNFFDVKQFAAKRKIAAKPEQFLLNSNYIVPEDPEVNLMREVAKHYGARLAVVGQNFVPAADIMKAIEDSDVVIGMGRSVLEGVCAGRLGIVHGRWGYGGVIAEPNIENLRYFNFSGRNSGGHLPSAQDIIAEIDRFYNPQTIAWGQKYIREQHNAVFAAEVLIQTARALLEESVPAADEVPLRPFRRARDVAQSA